MLFAVKYSPNSVHTVGVLAVTLGLAVWCASHLDVYVDQLLCAGAVLRACRLAPVQTKRSVASLFAEKHNGFSTLFLSAQIVLLVASGRSLVGLEDLWMSLQGCLEVPPEPFWVPRNPPPRFLFQDSSLRIPPQGFLLQDSSSRIPPAVFLSKDFSSRSPP